MVFSLEVNLIIFGVVLVLLVTWLRNSEGPVAVVLVGWCKQAWRSFVGPYGYLAVVTLLGAYVGLYSIMEARHDRRMNRAIIERTTFLSTVSSGNAASFIAAMKNFGPLQNIKVPVEPDLLAIWRWIEEEKPNEEPLRRWARVYLAQCQPKRCGGASRIDLRYAGLWKANLRGADLRGADLGFASLVGANLTRANLEGANLKNAILWEAILVGANLRDANFEVANLKHAILWAPLGGANLAGANFFQADLGDADLRGTKNLTQAQIDQACVDEKTKLPTGLKKPEKILSIHDCRAKLAAEQRKKK